MAIKDVLLLAFVSRVLIGFFVLKTSDVINAVVVAVDSETVTEGGNVTLSCRYNLTTKTDNGTTRYELENVEWYVVRPGSDYKRRIFKKDLNRQPRVEYPYKGRIQYVGSDDHDGSIVLSEVTLQDEGRYVCEVYVVLDSRTGQGSSNATTVTVQVPPSTPIIEGCPISVYASDTISLSCSAEPGKPQGEITWHKRLADDTLVTLGSGHQESVERLRNGKQRLTSVFRTKIEMTDDNARFICMVNNSAVTGDPPSVVTHSIKVVERTDTISTTDGSSAAEFDEVTTESSESSSESLFKTNYRQENPSSSLLAASTPPTTTEMKSTTRERSPPIPTEAPKKPPIISTSTNACQAFKPGMKIKLYCHANLGQNAVLEWRKELSSGRHVELRGLRDDYYQNRYTSVVLEKPNPKKLSQVISVLEDGLTTEDERSRYHCVIKRGSRELKDSFTVQFQDPCNCPERVPEPKESPTTISRNDMGAIIAAIVLGTVLVVLVITCVLFVMVRLYYRRRTDGKFLLDLPVHPRTEPRETQQPPVTRTEQQLSQEGNERYVPPSPTHHNQRTAPQQNEEHVYFEIQHGEVCPNGNCSNGDVPAQYTTMNGPTPGAQYEEPVCCCKKNCKHKRNDYFVLEDVNGSCKKQRKK